MKCRLEIIVYHWSASYSWRLHVQMARPGSREVATLSATWAYDTKRAANAAAKRWAKKLGLEIINGKDDER